TASNFVYRDNCGYFPSWRRSSVWKRISSRQALPEIADLFACTFLFVCQSPSNSHSHLNLENHISLNYQTSFTCDTFNMPKFFSMLIYQRLTIITHIVTTLVCLYEILPNAGCINSVCCFIRR